MAKIFLLALISAALCTGCSRENPASVGASRDAEITAGGIVAIAEETDDLGDESFWIACSIGAQLLESKFDQFTAAGLDATVFDRLPDNQLTRDIERLYLDMKALHRR